MFLDYEEILKNSINSGYNLKFNEFIEYNKINLNEIFVDNLFHNIQNNLPIYMDEDKIGYFGYSGDIKEQKKSLYNIIKENFLEHKNKFYFEYNNKEYIKFKVKQLKFLTGEHSPVRNIDDLYPIKDGKNSSKIKHLIITPKLFKELLMLCNTEKGKQVRKYYIEMVEVMELYIKYQNKMIIRTLEQKLDNISMKLEESTNQLIETNTQLKEERIKADEERKKADEERKKSEERYQESQRKSEERFNALLDIAEEAKEEVIVKIEELAETKTDLGNVILDRVSIKRISPNRYNYIVILKDSTINKRFPYYVLRIQEKSISTRISSINKTYPNTLEIFRIYNPNASMSWLSICDKYKENIITTRTNWFSLSGITEEHFKNKIIEMDETERKNPKYM